MIDLREREEVGGQLTLKKPRKWMKRGIGLRQRKEMNIRTADNNDTNTQTANNDNDGRICNDNNGDRPLRWFTVTHELPWRQKEKEIRNARATTANGYPRMNCKRDDWLGNAPSDQATIRKRKNTNNGTVMERQQRLRSARKTLVDGETESQTDCETETEQQLFQLARRTAEHERQLTQLVMRTSEYERKGQQFHPVENVSKDGKAEARTSSEGNWDGKDVKERLGEARKREETAFFLGFLVASCVNQALQEQIGNLQRQISTLVMASGLMASQHAFALRPTPEESTDSEPHIGPTTVTRETNRMSQACCRMPLPAPGSLGAPWFEGKNVTEFLEMFDNMCEDYSISEQDRLKKVSRYCEFKTREYVQTLLYDEDD